MAEIDETREQKVSRLCQKSLDEKWFKGSQAYLDDDCPFCKKGRYSCVKCFCPPEICSHDPNDFVRRFIEKYMGRSRVSTISDSDLDEIRGAFQSHIIKVDKDKLCRKCGALLKPSSAEELYSICQKCQYMEGT